MRERHCHSVVRCDHSVMACWLNQNGFSACRGYFIRVVAIRHLLCTFLRSCDGRGQVLSLGAGFDTTFFRLKRTGVLEDCVQYVEVWTFVCQHKLYIVLRKGLRFVCMCSNVQIYL